MEKIPLSYDTSKLFKILLNLEESLKAKFLIFIGENGGRYKDGIN